MILKVKKLSPDAVIPKRAYPGDAGLDLVANSVSYWSKSDLSHNVCAKVDFGIAVEIPDGYVGLIFPRSSIYKRNVRLSNAVGVIDSGYRGEISAIFDIGYCRQGYGYIKGDRCAQLVILPLPYVDVVEADELTQSERGNGAYGSSDLWKGGQA